MAKNKAQASWSAPKSGGYAARARGTGLFNSATKTRPQPPKGRGREQASQVDPVGQAEQRARQRADHEPRLHAGGERRLLEEGWRPSKLEQRGFKPAPSDRPRPAPPAGSGAG